MHICYSLFTNEASLLDSQISITSLGHCSSWHFQRCFSAFGMSKSTPSHEWRKYLKTRVQNKPLCAFYGVTGRSGHVDRMLRSVLPEIELLHGDWTLSSIWSALTGHVRSRFSLSGSLLESTGRWHLASDHSPLSIQSHQMKSP